MILRLSLQFSVFIYIRHLATTTYIIYIQQQLIIPRILIYSLQNVGSHKIFHLYIEAFRIPLFTE